MWTGTSVLGLERFCTVSVKLKIPGVYWIPLSTWSFASMTSKILSAALSRNVDTIPHSTLCASKSAGWPSKRRVEIWTENVSIGQEPDTDESVGSGAFCIECEECSMYILPLSGLTLCAVKCSGASTVVSSRASNARKAAPATTAMSSSACDTPTHLAPSSVPLGAPVCRWREGGRREWAPSFRVLVARSARAMPS